MTRDVLFFFCHKEKGTERALHSKIASVNQYSQKPKTVQVCIMWQYHLSSIDEKDEMRLLLN